MTGGGLFLVVFVFVVVLRQGFFVHSPGCPGTSSIDQAGPELRDLTACA